MFWYCWVHGCPWEAWSTYCVLHIKIDFIPNSSKSPITPHVQVEFPAHFLSPGMVFVLLEPMQVLCILSQSLWVDVCKCPAMYVKYCFLSHPPLLTLIIFSAFFSTMTHNSLEEGEWYICLIWGWSFCSLLLCILASCRSLC